VVRRIDRNSLAFKSARVSLPGPDQAQEALSPPWKRSGPPAPSPRLPFAIGDEVVVAASRYRLAFDQVGELNTDSVGVSCNRARSSRTGPSPAHQMAS